MIPILETPIPFGGGIQLNPNKSISLEQELRACPIPKILTIPIRQHIGLTTKPIVGIGEQVLKGQLIAEAQGHISAPVHASTSGIIKDIGDYPVPSPSAASSTCIVIETDGEDCWFEDQDVISDFYQLSPLEVQRRIAAAGIVGMGGAGFPSAVKLIPGLSLDVELLILNAAECEPYITCDEILIRQFSRELIKGIEILAHALQVDDCVIAIEENKTEAINILQEALDQYDEINIQLKKISTLYPAGGEKQIIKSITGVDVPAGGLPVDIGVVCYNVATAMAAFRAVLESKPLISRIVTVTGPGITQARNLEVLIGTPIKKLIEECGGYNELYEYLIMGGPMMGFRLSDDGLPIIKTSNCILAAGLDTCSSSQDETACIRCDECARVCPVNLQPQQLHWFTREFDQQRLEDYHLFDCIECGCCSYVCPSHIPLVDNYRRAKSLIWGEKKKLMDAEHNRQRYHAKQYREEQRSLERQHKRELDIPPSDTNQELIRKQKEIAASVQRMREKRKK